MTDILDRLAGYAPDSPVARLREGRRQARDNAQASYRALFEPEDPGGVGRRERYAVAAFVAGLHADHAASDHYRGLLATEAPEILDALTREADGGRTEGPYGSYPPGPLSVENKSGPVFAVSDATRAALGPRLAKSPYFRLLSLDPAILAARTLADKDIFYNPEGGLPRAERELAATATSRLNGCIYCASVHARFAAHHSKRQDDVRRLLDEGVSAGFGERWDAITAASVALTATPVAFGPDHVARLRRAGLEDAAIMDVINGAAFFNWANRLMLSLGEPARR